MLHAQNDHVANFLTGLEKKYGSRPAFFGRTPTSGGDLWKALSFKDVAVQARKVADQLMLQGLERGDRVLLLAVSRPEYSVGFFGVLLAGGVVVPVDMKLTLDDQTYIANFSDAKFILSLDGISEKTATSLVENSQNNLKALSVETILQSSLQAQNDFNHSACRLDEVALVAFTSGTTSSPKGVMLKWSHLVYEMQTLAVLFRRPQAFRMLSILPLHHMFEIMAGFLMPFSEGGTVFYGNSMLPHQILSFIKDQKIRNMLTVPLFLRALKKGIESEIQKSKAKTIWFKSTSAIARMLPFSAIRRLLFFPIHKKLGGHLDELISGASALDLEVARFFETIGISVYEGYGLTETSPVITTNHRHAKKLGSIGRPIPGVEMKICPVTQEILIRGPNVMVGYYKNIEATQACLSSDGWFNTGDVGEMDADGFVSIKGRNKDLVVLGSGKKVVPEEVEAVIRDMPNVQEICIIGTIAQTGATKGTEVVTAVIVPDPQSKVTQEIILENVKAACSKISYYKRPTHFIFLEASLPKTSTLKVKRSLVKELVKERTAL